MENPCQSLLFAYKAHGAVVKQTKICYERNMIMRLQNLSVFLSVAKSKSVSEAARIEHLSQPAVSSILASLEREVGAELFKREMRQKKPIEITRQGQIFMKYAKQVLQLTNSMELEIFSDQMVPDGFTVASGRSSSQLLLPALIKKFRAAYPDVQVNVKTYADSNILHSKLLEHDCDIGLSSFIPKEPGLVYSKIMSDPLVLICPSDMGISSVISTSQLRKMPLIIREDDCYSYSLMISGLKQAGLDFKDMNVVMQVFGNSAVIQSVGMGIGCGIVPRSLACNNLTVNSGFKVVSVRNLSMDRDLYFVQRDDGVCSCSMKLFCIYSAHGQWYEDLFSYDPYI